MLQDKNTGEFIRILVVDATDEIVFYQYENNSNVKRMNKWDFIEIFVPISTYH